MNSDPKHWFGGKEENPSWVPSSWQGWVSIFVFGGGVVWSTLWYSQQTYQPAETYSVLYGLMLFMFSGSLWLVMRFKSPKK